jgi:XTP/dITP diphosphohydrolase
MAPLIDALIADGLSSVAVTSGSTGMQVYCGIRTRDAQRPSAYAKLRRPVLVDDTGLVLNAWNGLPGALIAWFLRSVGVEGILTRRRS